MSRDTTREAWLTTPRAILLGAFVIGALAYLGLRERSAPAPLTATPPAPGGSTPVVGGVSVSSRTEAPAVGAAIVPDALSPSAAPVAERSTVEATATKALDAHRTALKRACWMDRPPEARVRVMMNVTFDRTGAQIARGLSEPRLPEQQRAWLAGLGQCIQTKLPALSIDPPGASVQVEIPIDFP